MRLPALLFLKIVLSVWDLLWFHMNFRIIFFYFSEKCHWNFDGNALNLQMALGSKDISDSFDL